MHHDDVVHSSWLSLCFLTLLAFWRVRIPSCMPMQNAGLYFALPGNLCADGDRR